MEGNCLNIKAFYWFRVFFNARLYYPVFAVLFLDFGLTLEQFALLNSVWAATIVVLEVPSGALADAWGRVNLLRLAAVLMIVEMLLILLAPVGHSTVVFWMFVLNRMVSGTAEAMASGADEALAYDTLVVEGNQDRWPHVLEKVMRYQSAGFMVAMLMGGLLYDRTLLNRGLAFVGIPRQLPFEWVVRLPVVVTFLGALSVWIATLLMREPEVSHDSQTVSVMETFRLILASARKVLGHRVMCLVIIVGLLHDSVIRMILTLSSEYYRWIGVDARYFGVLGALMAVLGLVMPTLGRKLVGTRFGGRMHFGLTAALTWVALTGIGHFRQISLGIFYMALMMAGFSLLNYFVSYYLNREAPSRERATILSFRGLAYNLAYGLIGMLYAGYCRVLPFEDDTQVFGAALKAFPVWFWVTMTLFGLLALLRQRPRGTSHS